MYESTANFIGKDGFNWWIGQVENDGHGSYDVETKEFVEGDYDWSNKVKVRIVGYHNDSRVELPTEELPWAQVIMPPIYAQRSGIGSIHQLQINSWVIGFFMDGASAQIPIVMGSLTDENPTVGYGTKDGSDKGFAQLAAREYDERHHVTTGSGAPNTGDNIETDKETNIDKKKEKVELDEDTIDDNNKSHQQFITESESGEIANNAKLVTVHVGNGKCGSEVATKLEAPLAEFMKFARGIEQNDINEFIDKATGKVVDLDLEISRVSERIGSKLRGLTANIKGVVMEETNKLIQDGLDKINIPNPDLDVAVKDQLKNVGDLVSCLFKQIVGELGDFIKGLLKDLIENVLDTSLCLVQNILGDIMSEIMNKVNGALGILKGVAGAIKGAASKIQAILNKVGDFIDLFCDGALSCAIGASVFETGVGPKKKGNDAKEAATSQYAFKPPNSGTVVGNGKPKNGFVPFLDKSGVKKVFDTTTGTLVDLNSAAGKASGLSDKSFDTRGPLEKFEDINFYDSNGKPSMAALQCNSANLNRKPCFPELVWENLKSTSPVKAIAIVDDIGQMLGVLMRKKGSNVNREAQLKAQFTCNEPEGSGAVLKPNIINGVVDSVSVLNFGLGYGFDPASTFCPNEQYAVMVLKSGLSQHVNDGEFIQLVSDTSPDVLQVVDVDYDESHILLATIDPLFSPNIVVGMNLRTKSGHEFVLNFNKKFPYLVIPPDATAIYARCGDLIPRVNNVNTVRVGRNYVNPQITIGSGKDKKVIGTYSVDNQGRLVEPTLTETVLGFVKPVIEDRDITGAIGSGTGAEVSVVYGYSGPRELQENNALPLKRYIDCVGHPMIKSKKEDEEDALTDRGLNVVDGTAADTTTDSATTTPSTVSTPTEEAPVTTPVAEEPQQQQQQQQQYTPPPTPPAQNNPPPQQGGYGGY